MKHPLFEYPETTEHRLPAGELHAVEHGGKGFHEGTVAVAMAWVVQANAHNRFACHGLWSNRCASLTTPGLVSFILLFYLE